VAVAGSIRGRVSAGVGRVVVKGTGDANSWCIIGWAGVVVL